MTGCQDSLMGWGIGGEIGRLSIARVTWTGNRVCRFLCEVAPCLHHRACQNHKIETSTSLYGLWYRIIWRSAVYFTVHRDSLRRQWITVIMVISQNVRFMNND